MAELQKSVSSFRRSGSSGLVWDDKFLSGISDQNQNPQENQREQRQGHGTLQRSRSGSAASGPYRTVNVAPQLEDPPSPKVAACCFFGKQKPVGSGRKSKTAKSKKRR